jgi:hypothetical protein
MIYYGYLVRYLAMQVRAVDLGKCGTGRSGRGTAVSDPTVVNISPYFLQKFEMALLENSRAQGKHLVPN